MATGAIEAVLQNHVQALVSHDLDGVMKDYTEDSVVFSPRGVTKGLNSIRASFSRIITIYTPEVIANMKTIRQEIYGEYAYVLWSAVPAVLFGGDTFHIRDGKILMQSFIGQTKS